MSSEPVIDCDFNDWLAGHRIEPKTVEEKIIRCCLIASEGSFRNALALTAEPHDEKLLRKLARERRVTGRLIKTMWVAEDLFSGKIDKDRAGVEIRRFAIPLEYPR